MRIQRLDDRCDKCMLCVRDCAYGVWQVVDGAPVAAKPDLCVLCGHCAAVCPRNAICHDGLDWTEIAAINRKNLQPDIFREIIVSRRAVRQFKDEPVSRDVIEQVLDVARFAPTASNDQNVSYTVVTDKKLLEETAADIFGFVDRQYGRTQKGLLKWIVRMAGWSENRYFRRLDVARKLKASGGDPILYGAPALILIHVPRKAQYGCQNGSIAAATIINYAHAVGLGACFMGYMTLALRYSKKMRGRFLVPQDRDVHLCLVMGYPSYRHVATASRKKADITWI